MENTGSSQWFVGAFVVRFSPAVCGQRSVGGWALQAAVDPLDGVSFILGDDALLDVGVDLLVHEFLQLGQVIIWSRRTP